MHSSQNKRGAAMEPEYVGTLRMPVSMLTFLPPDQFHQDDFLRTMAQEQLLRADEKAAELAHVFTQEKCEPSAPENQMLGIITSEVLHNILTSLQLSKEDLHQTSISGNYMFVDGNYSIWCVRGRLSALAARIAFGEKAWWTVKVFHFQDTDFRLKRFVQRASEEFAHENVYSDGAVYRKIRYYSDRGDISEAKKWLLRLSSPKQNNLFYLLKRKAVTKAFDELMPFIGLWGGLQLGNIHKHLALHCDEQIILYIKHIRLVWFSIIQDEKFLDMIDLETVQFLELKAPSASSADRISIQKAMEHGRLFPLVLDSAIRQKLLLNIMKLTVVIPSIATLHHNMKYFGLGAKILQKYIEVLPTKSRKSRSTLFQNLKADWNAPREAVCEVAAGKTVRLVAMTPETSYLQLFVAALRDFLPLIHELPLQDKGGKEPISCEQSEQQHSRITLVQLARNLGFRNSKIEGVLPSVPRELPMDYISKATPDWRGGKPSLHTFRALRSVAFLPQLYKCEKISETPSPCFILNDFICAFFGSFKIINDSKDETPSIVIEMPTFIALHQNDVITMLKQNARGRCQSTNRSFRITKPRRKATAAISEKLREALNDHTIQELPGPRAMDTDMPDSGEVRTGDDVRTVPSQDQDQLIVEERVSDSMRDAATTQNVGVDRSGTSQAAQSLNSYWDVRNPYIERRKLYQQLQKDATKRRFEDQEFYEQIRVPLDEERLQKRRKPNPVPERGLDALTGDLNQEIREVDEGELQLGRERLRLRSEPEEFSRADDEGRVENAYEEDGHESDLQATNEPVEQMDSAVVIKEAPTVPLREERRSVQQPLKRHGRAQGGIPYSLGQKAQEKDGLAMLSSKRQTEYAGDDRLSEETKLQDESQPQILQKAASSPKRRFETVGDYNEQTRGSMTTEDDTKPTTKRKGPQEYTGVVMNERISNRGPGIPLPPVEQARKVVSTRSQANNDRVTGRTAQPKDRIQDYLQRNRLKRTFDDMESRFNEEIRQVTQPQRIRENFKRRRYLENQAASQTNSGELPAGDTSEEVYEATGDSIPNGTPHILEEDSRDLMKSAPREAVRSVYIPEASWSRRAGVIFDNVSQMQNIEREASLSSEIFSQTARPLSAETLESTSTL